MKPKNVEEASEAGSQAEQAGSVAACPECVYLSNQPDLKYTQTETVATTTTHTHTHTTAHKHKHI